MKVKYKGPLAECAVPGIGRFKRGEIRDFPAQLALRLIASGSFMEITEPPKVTPKEIPKEVPKEVPKVKRTPRRRVTKPKEKPKEIPKEEPKVEPKEEPKSTWGAPPAEEDTEDKEE